MDMDEFVKDRDAALIEAVNNDNWDAVKSYCAKYEIPVPRDEMVMKAGIYKAVQMILSIPEDVKDKAFLKCLDLGFSPFPYPVTEKESNKKKKSQKK